MSEYDPFSKVARRDRHRKAIIGLGMIGGRITRGSQQHTLRTALLLSDEDLGPAAARSLHRELDAACLTAAALWIHGELGDDVIFGWAGNDLLVGSAGDDRLFGGAGDDQLHSGPGIDIANGGSGIDGLVGRVSGNAYLVNNTLYTISPGLFSTGSLEGIETVSLYGNANDNMIMVQGFKGSVNLHGNSGNDTLVGSSQDDYLYGGAGDDRHPGGR